MGRVTGSFSRPIQGVSQQPAKVRLDGQCEVSENFKPDAVQGLITRPASELTAFFKDETFSAFDKIHDYDRGDNEEYFIRIKPTGRVEVTSPDGRLHIVNESSDVPSRYIKSPNPQKDVDLVTIGDFTFISNNKIIVKESQDSSPARLNRSVVYVSFMDFSQTQVVTVDGVEVATYTSPDGSNVSQKEDVGTEFVSKKLFDQMVSNLGSGWTIELHGSCIYLWRNDFADFNLLTTDDANGDNLKGVSEFVTKLSDLPPRAPNGFMTEIRPAGSTPDSNNRYWLTAAANDSSDDVIWNESLEPDLKLGTDNSTMPVVLIRESIDSSGVATFSLKRGDWQNRDVGNDENNPLPSFVGSRIQNIGIFQNRLYVTSGESVVMSRTSNFFNFFRETTQTVLDTDPIDVYADAQKVNILKSSSALDGDLIFFSDNGQFRLDGSAPVSPSSAVLTQETQFQSNTDAPPVASGENLFFAFDYGEFVGIREFYTDNVTDTKRARPITEHISRYIEGRVRKMASSTTINTLIVQSDKLDNVLFVYDWLWQGTEKVQSAWGKWVLPEGESIKHFSFNNESLYLIIERDSGITYERIDLGDPDEEGLVFPLRLDSRAMVTATYSANLEYWVMSNAVPFVKDESELLGVRAEGCYPSEVGLDFSVEKLGDKLITYDELSNPIDGATVNVYIGRPFNCEYVPNQPVIRDQFEKPIGIDKLMLGVIWANYERTGFVTVDVEDEFGGTVHYEFNGRQVGGLTNLVGFAPEQDGEFRIPIRQKADRVKLRFKTNSHRPLQIRDFEYEGYWSPRGQRR